MEQTLTLESIAEEFTSKYGISPERTEYLMDVVGFRLLFKHPFKYLFNERQQVRESYRLVDRYLSIEKARNDKAEAANKLRFNHDKV